MTRVSGIAAVGNFTSSAANRLNGTVLLAHLDGSATPDITDPFYGVWSGVTQGVTSYGSAQSGFGQTLIAANANGGSGNGVVYTKAPSSVTFSPPVMLDLWIYPTTPTVNGQFFVSITGTGYSIHANTIASGGLWSFGFVSGSATLLSANTWNHIVLGADTTRRFYGSNGVIRAVETVSALSSMNVTSCYALGSNTFTGPGMKVDEIRLLDYLPPEFVDPTALAAYTVPASPYTS